MTKYSIRELRARMAWTQEETAKRIGISTTTYCSWERYGLLNIQVKHLLKLSEVFCVPIEEIKIG